MYLSLQRKTVCVFIPVRVTLGLLFARNCCLLANECVCVGSVCV